MKTPKHRFIEQKDFAERHRDLIASPWFQDAVHTALAEYAMRLRKEEAYLMVGAREFIDVFSNLSTSAKTPSSTLDTLDYGDSISARS